MEYRLLHSDFWVLTSFPSYSPKSTRIVRVGPQLPA